MATYDWRPGKNDAITDVPGIRAGHWTDRRAATGCTVVLCEGSSYAAADARGGAPGTRELDTLQLANLDQACQGILLTGGSAFGLAAAEGVVQCLAERGVGFVTAARPVPIVPGAVIYDLGIGSATRTPGPEAGYRAASAAKGGKIARGSVGAGTGATVAKLGGAETMLKGGLGTASLEMERGLVVGALAVVNALGVVVDPANGKVVAGPRAKAPGRFERLAKAIEARRGQAATPVLQNTTLVCVATNAAISHGQVQRLAYQAHNGIARTVLPAHTFGDGDVSLAVTMGNVEVEPPDVLTLGLLATLAVERAVLDAVRSATGLHGVPSAEEWMAQATTGRGR